MQSATEPQMAIKTFIMRGWGGVGDMLVCTPTFKAMKASFPKCRIVVYSWEGHREVLRNNPWIDEFRSTRSLVARAQFALSTYLRPWTGACHRRLAFQERMCPGWLSDKNVKDVVAEMLGVALEDKHVQIVLTPEEERRARATMAAFNKPVVLMHVYSKCSPNHHWTPTAWQELIASFPECAFLQVGAQREPLLEGALDWRGKTSLRELFGLVKYATSFVGVDSSVAHMTNAFDLPGVVLWGDSNPSHWGHDNNVNIYKRYVCSPCFYLLGGAPCPYENRCMKTISVTEVQQALAQQLERGSERLARIGS